MNNALACRKIATTLLAAGLLVAVSPRVSGDAEDSPGWTAHIPPADSWQEQPSDLPPYPQEANLLELDISTGGQPYTLYIDPLSIRVGEDSVVRYTVVMISRTGIWNVFNEGLHCGKRKYRRYAYGYDGEWREPGTAPWVPLSGLGVNRYRTIFYNVYMCNQAAPADSAQQVVTRLRSDAYGHGE